MKVMIDTNVIISAVLSPSGKAFEAFVKALAKPYEPVVGNYILDELHKKFEEKFPDKIPALEAFLYHMLRAVLIVPTPEAEGINEDKIRDTKARPIYRAAINAAVDYLLTGDKDFLSSGIKFPRIVTVQEFLSLTPSLSGCESS
ncbi:MAG: putative toxin-antitoxin system toxin component, PIN family [Synergistaceae bacterium]|nr:putative toxin-antitoxin system toxin component, PIN family [Synergistaceae bacterium]